MEDFEMLARKYLEWTEDKSKLHLLYKWADGSELSTIELPSIVYSHLGGKRWESCIFYANGYSEVVRTWDTEDGAREGHEKLIVEYSKHG